MQPLVLIQRVLQECYLVLEVRLLENPVVMLIHQLSFSVVLRSQRIYLLLVSFTYVLVLLSLFLLLP